MAEEYSDDELAETLERVHQWREEWCGSSAAQRLTDAEREEAEFVIHSFTEYMYSYHDLLPEEWDEATLEDCCLDTLARKISAEESYYRAIAPVLSSFFTYLAETGRLSRGTRLARRVEAISRRIVQHGNDPRYWGMAKHFAMGMIGAGVDLEDEAAVQAYVARQNERLPDLAELGPEFGDFEPMQPVRVVKTGRNEPCPCGSGKKYKKCCGR